MNRAARIVAVVPAVVVLGWLSMHAVAAGTAGSKVFGASIAMRAWSAKSLRSADVIEAVRESLLAAQSTTPRDPALHELLGLIDARSGSPRVRLARMEGEFTSAVEMRPTSPQTWSNLVATKYGLGDTGPAFEAALIHAAELGRFEPDVQAIVADYGLAVWNEVSPRTRVSIEALLAAAMKRNPLEMLQIADRRGRLAVTCHYVADSTRQVGPKWSKLCQSMEATS